MNFVALPPTLAGVSPRCSGLAFGSFVGMYAYRLPRNESIVRKRSFCPGCGIRIPAWRNIPLVSYALQKGRCIACKGPIHWRYPVSEALCGLLAWACWRKFGMDWSLAAGTAPLLRSGTAVGNRYGTPASSRPPHASSALAGPAFQPDPAGDTVRAAPASNHGRSRRLRIAGDDRFLVAAPTQAVGLRRRRPQTSGPRWARGRPLRSVRSLWRSSRNGPALRYAACTVEANCPAGRASVRSVPYARRRVGICSPRIPWTRGEQVSRWRRH